MLESLNLPSIITIILNLVVKNSATATIIGSLIGGTTPRLNSIIMNYKENRFERNVSASLQLLQDKIKDLDSRIFTDEQVKHIIQQEIPLYLDSLYDEQQEGKANYHVSMLVNSIGQDIDEGVLIDYYDTITQLAQIDIDVLSLYSPCNDQGKNYLDIEQKYHIKDQQYIFTREKLCRFGLLDSKNNYIRDENIYKALIIWKNWIRKAERADQDLYEFPSLIRREEATPIACHHQEGSF